MTIKKNIVRENFTTIPNKLITDKDLSMSAKVLYCYLASKPDDWDIWNKDISKALGIKTTNAIAKYFKELLDTGWLSREKKRSNNGKMAGGYDYTINVPNYGETVIREMPTLGQTHKHNNTDNSYENISLDINNTDIVKKRKKEFVKPTVEEIKAYCKEQKIEVDAEEFYYRNEAIGWVVGKAKTPMKDWKAAIRYWNRNRSKWNTSSKPKEETKSIYQTYEEYVATEKEREEYYRNLCELQREASEQSRIEFERLHGGNTTEDIIEELEDW